MPQSSRASIPPLSRAPSSSRPPATIPAQVAWQRHAFVGAGAGFLLSIPSLIGAGAVRTAPWQPLFLSALFSMALAGLFLSACGTLSWSLAAVFSRTKKQARGIAVITSSVVVAVYVLIRGAAEAFRVSSGAPLNLGTLEFFAASVGHLVGPLLSEYAPLALGLCALLGAAVWFAVRILRRAPAGVVSSWGLAWRGLASIFGFALLVRVLMTPGMTSGCGLSYSADLSLLSSIAVREEEDEEWAEGPPNAGPPIARGAPLVTGELWDQAAPRLEGPRPNVIILMLESVGSNHLGSFGYDRKVTPALDRIAASSLRFRTARSTASHSNYAQMAILSSLFPRRYTGLDVYKRLDYPRILWHDFLAPFGFRTATYSSQDETWQGMLRFQKTETPTEFHHSRDYEGEHLNMGAEKVVPDEVTASRAIEWMKRQKAPFGLYVNFQSTHFPYKIPRGAERPFRPEKPRRGKYHYLHYPKEDVFIVRNRYDNALAYVDRQVGRIYQYLEASRLLENTILVVTSDHGELFWEHDLVTHGRSLFEEEVRVPLFVHFPSRLQPRDVDRSVSTLDVLPTLAQLMDAPPHPAFQGTSLLDEASAERPVFMNIQGMKSQDAVVCGSYKLIHNRSARKFLLFDLARDPHEKHNLVEELPRVAQVLRDLLRAQMRAQIAYYAPHSPAEREQRFAPRFAGCPDLSEAELLEEDTTDPTNPNEVLSASSALDVHHRP